MASAAAEAAPSSQPSLPQPYSLGATWLEKLLLNLLSYSLVLLPIAIVVLATKYRLLPSFLQSSALIQLFVSGHYHQSASKQHGDTLQDSESLIVQDEDKKQTSSARRHDHDRGNVYKFLCCFSGLMVSYLVWGILQEKIMTTKYGKISPPIDHFRKFNEGYHDIEIVDQNNSSLVSEETHITFHDSQFLVFINRIIAFILAIVALIYDRPKREASRQLYLADGKYQVQYRSLRPDGRSSESTKPPAPLYKFVYCSLSNIMSSWCQYEALKYVNFPTQVLSKTFKIVPVMVMSKILLKKKYKPADYACALALSLGMFIFLVNQPPANTHTMQQHHLNQSTNMPLDEHQNKNGLNPQQQQHFDADRSTLLSGLLLLSLYLAFDSFTGNWQKSLFTSYQVTNWQMMAAVNLYSILLTLTSLYQQGNLTPALKLLASSRPLMFDCLLMSVMSSIGQFFVYYTINQFGPVIFTVIMTFRQFLAILISCLLYGHQLTAGSSLGILLVFMVVGFQIWHRSNNNNNNSNQNSAKSRNTPAPGDSIGLRLQSAAYSSR